ncbi:MAG: hypothetical protein WBA97_10890 [Actinophytocola sp.]|uniref:hypothetical protein n=1 Tax=Actinophytocola sp. TaxID=1872138 RepID=UPI003C731494
MLAELVAVAGAVLVLGSLVLLRETRDLRKRVRRADWLLTRADLAISEAQRASITVGGLQLVDHLLGTVAGNGEPDPDASR